MVLRMRGCLCVHLRCVCRCVDCVVFAAVSPVTSRAPFVYMLGMEAPCENLTVYVMRQSVGVDRSRYRAICVSHLVFTIYFIRRSIYVIYIYIYIYTNWVIKYMRYTVVLVVYPTYIKKLSVLGYRC